MDYPNYGNGMNGAGGNSAYGAAYGAVAAPVSPQAKKGFTHALIGAILSVVTYAVFCPVVIALVDEIQREYWYSHDSYSSYSYHSYYLSDENEAILTFLILQFIAIIVVVLGSQIFGIILSAIGLKKTREGFRGKGFAITGLIISIVGLATLPILFFVCYGCGLYWAFDHIF